MPFAPLPVILVADDPLVRRGLAALLPDEMPVVSAVGTDAVAKAVADAAAENEAHAVLWDADEAPPTPEELDHGLPTVLLVGGEVDPWRIDGALGVLRRDVDADRLAAALVSARAGLRCVDDRLPAPPRAGTTLTLEGEGPKEPLTPRETEVLELLAEGRSNREIALALDISVHTAKFHVDRLLMKLDASSRTDAVVRAVRLGLLVL
ncbi:MAG: response regulator transcription factor [Myxococcota bacterium]